MELVVEGECFISGKLEHLCIGIDQGRIAALGKRLEGDRHLDFGGQKILPGATDSHVHFRDPGMTHKEDFHTGSLAALHGGVTCVLDMPNTSPPTMTVDAMREKKAIAKTKSVVDFGLFAGIRHGADIAGLSKEAIGFKLYMAGTTGDLLVPSIDSVAQELEEIRSGGGVVAVHAEDEGMRKRDPERGLRDHLRNRRNECETSAIRNISKHGGSAKLHICHISARESIALVRQAKGITCEATPHHMLLDIDRPIGTMGKVNPPLRTRGDRQALFLAFKQGEIDVLASDHAPHTMDEKGEDFEYAPSGLPGVETMLPLVLNHVRERHLALATVVRAACERPAEIFGLNKGKIAVGFDADLVVVDFMAGQEIKGDRLHSKCGWTPFEGMSGIFPKAVIVGGELMMKDGGIVGERRGRDTVET